jgi:hypothetical protein
MMIVTDQNGGKEMSGISQDYSVGSTNSFSDNDIVVVSESSSKSLQEIGSVKELSQHQSRASLSESSSSKGKEHIELGLPGSEEMSNVSQSSEADDDFDVLRLYGSNPQDWWPGKKPLTQREVNLLTVTPAHQADYRDARCEQVFWGVFGTLEALFVPTSIGLAYYGSGFKDGAVLGPAAFGAIAAVAFMFAIISFYNFFRVSGFVRHTESNVS